MAHFYFSMGSVDDNFITAFTNLNRFEEPGFSELLQMILAFLSSPNEGQQLLAKLEKFSDNFKVPLPSLQLIVKAVLLFLRGCLKRSLPISQISEDLSNLGLDQERISNLAQKWTDSFTIISNVNQQRVLTIRQLTDLEWRFGVTTGNSLFNRVGQIFLQMKFKVISGEIITIELSIEQFYSFLHEMEKARASIEYLV